MTMPALAGQPAPQPTRPDPQRVGSPSDDERFVPGTPVGASDGPAGALAGVRRDPATGTVTHLLVRREGDALRGGLFDPRRRHQARFDGKPE